MDAVRTYSEWVIDGEYDWPPTCCSCQAVLEATSDSQTTRLGCLRLSAKLYFNRQKSNPPAGERGQIPEGEIGGS
ncbi:hypothetical protein ACLOJK_003608 [Asimina triloba]